MNRVLPLLLIGVVALTSCTPRVPEGPPPAFADDAAAFDAAVDAYETYLAALSAVDTADPATFEPVFDSTTGEANAEIRGVLTTARATRARFDGESVVVQAELRPFGNTRETVQLDVSLDVSNWRIVAADGTVTEGAHTADVQSLTVTIEHRPQHLDPAVAVIASRTDGMPC